MANPIVIDLIQIAQAQAIDTDYSLGELKGANLIRLAPLPNGSYPKEVHVQLEFIVALKGAFSIKTADANYKVKQGQAIKIPANVEHRWGNDSDAIVMVMFEEQDQIDEKKIQ